MVHGDVRRVGFKVASSRPTWLLVGSSRLILGLRSFHRPSLFLGSEIDYKHAVLELGTEGDPVRVVSKISAMVGRKSHSNDDEFGLGLQGNDSGTGCCASSLFNEVFGSE